MTQRDENNVPFLSKFRPVLPNYLANMNPRDCNNVVAKQKQPPHESLGISFISYIEDGFNELSREFNPKKETREMKFSSRRLDGFKA